MNYQQELEIVNKAIAKISAIPSDQFCSRIQFNEKGQRCFIGHYGASEGIYVYPSRSKLTLGSIKNSEADEIAIVLNKYIYGDIPEYCSIFGVMAEINNGDHKQFQQPTEKERIIAALEYTKKEILTNNPPVDDIIRDIKPYSNEYPELKYDFIEDRFS